MTNLMNFLKSTMTTPMPYGWFHILMLVLTTAFTIFLCIKFRNATDKQVKIILLVLSTVCLFLEAYKQLIFSNLYGYWDYQWYFFPLQFCSTPMFIAFIASFLKEGKVRNFMYSFLATYGMFAGLAVMLYPGDVFRVEIGINIQTMVHHALQITFGAFLLSTKRVKIEQKTILKALPVFVSLVLIALGFNITLNALGEGVNMFFISPYIACPLPLLSMVYGAVPYPVFLIVYILGFTLCGYIVLMASLGLTKLYKLVFKPKKLED